VLAGPRLNAELGKYELLCLLATGGMATVHLARAKGIGGFEKLLVIKRILPRAANEDSSVQMFLAEARIAATLEHSNIVHVFDVGLAQNEVFLAMEFLHGHDVRSIVRATRGPLPIGPTLAIAIGACAGLHYAHEKRGPKGQSLGLVHRDVSPSNVVVTYDGGVKVIDFGIAKASGRHLETESGILKGKPGYMSPEQCLGLVLDRRSDIFCVGIMLYELTTGSRLFGPKEAEYLQLKAIVESEVAPPSTIWPECPKELERIVMKALARTASERYATAADLQHDLEHLARASQLDVSATGLSKFMERTFADELAAWRAAEASGIGLAQHVMASGAGRGSLGRVAIPEGPTTRTDHPDELRQHVSGLTQTELAQTELATSGPDVTAAAGTASHPARGAAAGAGADAPAPGTGPRRAPGLSRVVVATLGVAAVAAAVAGSAKIAGSWRRSAAAVEPVASTDVSAPATPAGASGAPYALISHIENRTTDPVFDGTLELIVESALKRSPTVYPLAGQLVRMLSAEVSPKVHVEEEDLGRVVSEKTGRPVATVLGSIASDGAGYVISLHAKDGRTQAPILSSTTTVANADAVAPAVARFAWSLRAALGDPSQPDEQEKMGLSLSMEANHEFATGRADLGAGKLTEAIEHLEHALEIDPHFGLAAGALGTTLMNAGRTAEGEARYRSGLADASRMSDRERLLSLALYHMARDEFDASSKAYEELFARWPFDTRFRSNLASVYLQAGDLARGLPLAEKSLEEHPWSPVIRGNAVIAEVLTGHFEKAVELTNSALAEMAHSLPSTYAFGAMAEATLGHRDRAVELYGKLRQADPAAATNPEADDAAMEGRLADADAALAAGIRADIERKASADARRKWSLLAEVRLRRGDARGAAEAALRALPAVEVVPLYRAARVLVDTGHVDEAGKVEAQIAAHPGPRARLYAVILHGEALAVRGKKDEAIETLKTEAKDSDAWLLHAELGWMELEQGALALAERELSLCAQRRGEGISAFLDDTTTGAYLPKVLLGLARAKEGLHESDAVDAFTAVLAVDDGKDDPIAHEAHRHLPR
jgi:tetratricopeptide (TPR) repeat protein